MLFFLIFTPLGSTLYQWYNANLTETVTGEIVISELRYASSGRFRECKVQYLFSSRAGSPYESSTISYFGGATKQTCNKYALGDSVTVFYDPEDPTFSVLEKTGLGESYYSTFYEMFLLCFGLALLMNLGFIGSSSGDGACGDGGGGGD